MAPMLPSLIASGNHRSMEEAGAGAVEEIEGAKDAAPQPPQEVQ